MSQPDQHLLPSARTFLQFRRSFPFGRSEAHVHRIRTQRGWNWKAKSRMTTNVLLLRSRQDVKGVIRQLPGDERAGAFDHAAKDLRLDHGSGGGLLRKNK